MRATYADAHAAPRPRHHRHRLGQLARSTPELDGPRRRHRRGRHVRWHLPQRGLHPDQDVRATPPTVAVEAADAARLGVDATLDPGATGPASATASSGGSTRSRPAAQAYRAEQRPTSPLYAGHARFTGPAPARLSTGEDVTADRFVLAAGGQPVCPTRRARGPGPPASTPPTRSCGWRRCRARMVIIGGGFVAAEFAHVFASFGVAVTQVQRAAGAAARTTTPRSRSASRRSPPTAGDVRLRPRRPRPTRRRRLADRLDCARRRSHVEAEVVLVATGRPPTPTGST